MTSLNTITYEGTRNSLIDYFSSQDEFKSYNFTAPGISTLIDALAYTIHYMSVYANFALNESFLDTATQRTAVVSKSKGLGYMPYQYTSSVAKVKIEYTGTANLDNVVIPAGTQFVSNINNSEYVFHTIENTLLNKTDLGRYWAELYIREGVFITQRWTQDANGVRFILSHPHVDIDNLTVKVYDSESDTIGVEYDRLLKSSQLVPSINKMGYVATPTVYTLMENTTGDIELLFGDDIISKKIITGNIVECTYLASNGSLTNNSMNFSLKSLPIDTTGIENYNSSLWVTTCIEQSSGGADREEIDSIKKNAPKFFQRQSRDVVADDYRTAILTKYGGIIDAINVWGGEDNIPPKYGSVCACIKPKTGTKLSQYKKKEITDYIYESSVVGITFEIVDADILYIDANISCEYDMVNSKYNMLVLKEKISEAIKSYFDILTMNFKAEFIYSRLLADIFNIDNTIEDTVINLTMSKYLAPVSGIEATYEVRFDNELKPGSIYSDTFLQLSDSYKNAVIKDDSNGKLHIMIDNKRSEIGKVDYTTGVLSLIYKFEIFESNNFKIYAVPKKLNVETGQNVVFSLNNTAVILNGE